MSSRAKHLFSRFGTLQERLQDNSRSIQRVNRAAEFMNEEKDDDDQKYKEVNEQEEDDHLNIIDKVQGVGASEGYGKTPAYSEHGPDYVRFAAMTAKGIPFVATMSRISLDDGIAWVNRRIKGFKDNPKSRESIDDAIRRKALAAMGLEFIDAMKLKASDMTKMEMDMMFSENSHSGIGVLDMISKRPDVVDITITRTGDIEGLDKGILTDSDSQIYITKDMIGRV